MAKRLKYEDIKQAFEKEGYELLEEEYLGSNVKMQYKCPQGHVHEMCWDNFKQGKRCPDCQKAKTSKMKTKDFNTIKQSFEKEGYILLTKEEEYKNARTKLYYICPNNHKHSIVWNSFNNGNRCPECAKINTRLKLKLDFSIIKQEIEKEGYVLLSTDEDYINNASKLKMICPEDHKCEISWSNFQQGKRCRECAIKDRAKKQRIDFSIIQKAFEKEGYVLLSKEEEYENKDSKLLYLCNKGHKNITNWSNFNGGCRCPKCNSPKGERKIIKYLESNNISFIHDKNIWNENDLRPDFYLPSYNLVIEFDGIQHFEPVEHFGGERNFKITQKRDRDKNEYCKKNNINILRIPYWEFDNIENIICQEIEKLKTFND